jgi:Rps23 Pro-64 3,4-dihydroxylase Tpa1-like proline 4-hydroxylase
MKLAYSYKDEVFWIQNFLSNDYYKLVHSIIIKNRNLINKKTELNWKQEYNSNSMYDFDKSIIKPYEVLLKHQNFIKLINYNLDSHIRKYSYMESLNWHNDLDKNFVSKRKYAASYYINKNWNEHYAGELMFKDDYIKGFIQPLGNSLVIIKTGFRHKVNPILTKNIERFSIQTWVNEE